MMEQWHPLGPVVVITGFNFPGAVWAWDAALAAVCGDPVVWKPAEPTPLTAIAVQHIANRVMADHGVSGVFNLVVGPGRTVGERMLNDHRLPLISFTGSTAVGRRVAQVVAGRFGRTILELGGNNAIIVTADARLDLALRAILFGAVGTAGQRCTSTRRLIVHRSISAELVAKLRAAYSQVPIGDPLAAGTLMGPLVTTDAVDGMLAAIEQAKAQGGEVVCGGRRREDPARSSSTDDHQDAGAVRDRRAGDVRPDSLRDGVRFPEEAIHLHNAVPQGLSSAMFTENLRAAERFLSVGGSDCGIANVNIGTSGAEIGGAFGGEKETGGGRESGSDAWKAYMRRQTNTVNWSDALPLAQGIEFGI